jgi:hypothetical protein
MLRRTAIRFVIIAAVAIPSLTAGKSTRAEQSTIRPPDLDMPDATHGKVGITHKSLLKSVCGFVREKNSGPRPFLYLVPKDEAYIGGYNIATSAYRHICSITL